MRKRVLIAYLTVFTNFLFVDASVNDAQTSLPPQIQSFKCPSKPTMMEGLSLSGICARGHSFDIAINGTEFTVSEAGKKITKPLGEDVIFSLEEPTKNNYTNEKNRH